MDDVTRRRIESFDRCETWFTANANAFEAAAQSSAQGQKVGKRALILAGVDELMQLKRTSGYINKQSLRPIIRRVGSLSSSSNRHPCL